MPPPLFSHYSRPADRFDEMLDAHGTVRPHWHTLLQHLKSASPAAMRQRVEVTDRSIAENGIAYNVYGDPDGRDRPWALDPLPLIIAADEWRQLSDAVAQRARLLNAVLADLYGSQHLLGEGLLPPSLVYGQHGFLWPCHGVKPPGGVFLHHYAVDLARSPDGHWWVIGDRTQAPSGAGYALENRLIVSRVFPQLFRDLRVQRLASFFATLQQSYQQWAPVDEGEQPLVVLLTPGPYNETYFEHAYLARYLGYPLVEGQDLTVRDDTVYLKTLTGLRRVHAILRRQDDDFCDPLELRGDSALGIPGLLHAVRAGRVMISNALGSGLPGSSAVMGFLPAIARRLLDEELMLPSVATWWCGEAPAREYVLDNLDALVIKGTYPSQRLEPVFGRELKGAARDEMVRRIRARSHAYVAQELVRLSQAPVWSREHAHGLQPRSVGLRLYAVATPEGYQVMPGGLARAAGSADALVLSMQRGGAAKDTWVLADSAVDTFSLLKPANGKGTLVRAGNNLSSRVVENLFWQGRYAERFDGTTRLLRLALAHYIDNGGESTPEFEALVALCLEMKILPPGREENDEEDSEEAEWIPVETRLRAAVHDATTQNSVADTIGRLFWAASQVRERLSLDHWYSLNRLQRDVQAPTGAEVELGEILMLLDRLLQVSSSLTGFTMDNMTRDIGWRMLLVGRRVERLGFLAGAISAFLRTFPGRSGRHLEWLLEFSDSIITYRSRYLRTPDLLTVVDLIVFDESNPHSVMFQVNALEHYLLLLEEDLGEVPGDEFSAACSAFRAIDLAPLQDTPDIACVEFARCLKSLEFAAYDLSNRIGMRFFSHVGAVSHQTLAR
ncbi:MAG: circularly permuted type 2 ATP-grasp protein [Rhodocyclaceae bacterium]|nr:circularly permuted type 2 ATP-grasp protein [Rhodocyclaceae bacterium]